MKATATFTTLALAASVLASDWSLPRKRDVATIQTVIQDTQNALTQLDTTVKAFDGQNATKLATDAGNLQKALTQGTSQIQGTTPITANEAVTLQASLQPVQDVAQALATNLVAKKTAFEQAKLCDVIFSQTKDLSVAAKGLIDATVQKTPPEIQQVATQLTAQFTAQLDSVSGNFAKGNCTNAGGAAVSNGTSSSNTGSSGGATGVTKSAAPASAAAGAFGMLVAAAVGLLML